MPVILKVVTADQTVPSGEAAPYPFRISPKGTIILPVVGEVVVEGLTLFEIEAKVCAGLLPNLYQDLSGRACQGGRVQDLQGQHHRGRPKAGDLRSQIGPDVPGILDHGSGGDRRGGGRTHPHQSHPENAVDLSKPEALSGLRLSQSIGDRARWDGSVGMVSDAVDATPDLEMSFRPLYSHSTLGQLRVSRRGRILAGGEVDLASQAQRQAVLQTVYASDPTASIGYLDRQMASLAERLEADLTTGNLATLASAIEAPTWAVALCLGVGCPWSRG